MMAKGQGMWTTGSVIVLVFLTATLFASCSDDGNNGQVNQQLVGNWQPGEGDLFPFFPGVESVVLQLRDDSTGELVLRDPESGALACLDLIYAELSDEAVFIDLEVYDEVSAFQPKNFAFAVDGNELTLTDNVGRSQTFTKLEAVPAGAECQAFSEVVASDALEADPLSETGLVSDGSSLWFGADDQPSDKLMPYVIAAGRLGVPIDLPSNVAEVQAYDGTLLWFHTGVGYIASGRNFADVEIDTIDTDLDLGHRLSIRAMAWDGTHLWFSGQSNATGERELLQVDIGTKTLVNRYDFPLELSALTWDGTQFWGILSGSPSPLLQIDPDTRQVVATYEIPGYGQLFNRYLGLAAVDGALYVLMENRGPDSNTATILRAIP